MSDEFNISGDFGNLVNMLAGKGIEVNKLDEKDVEIDGVSYRVIKADAASIFRIQSKGMVNNKIDMYALNKSLLEHLTDGLDVDEFMTKNGFEKVNKLMVEISKFNGLGS